MLSTVILHTIKVVNFVIVAFALSTSSVAFARIFYMIFLIFYYTCIGDKNEPSWLEETLTYENDASKMCYNNSIV